MLGRRVRFFLFRIFAMSVLGSVGYNNDGVSVKPSFTAWLSLGKVFPHQKKWIWFSIFSIADQKTVIHLAILCALLWMVKWPFAKVKWAPTRESKGHFESPGRYIFMWFKIVTFLFPGLYSWRSPTTLERNHLTIPKKVTKNCQDVGISSFPRKCLLTKLGGCLLWWMWWELEKMPENSIPFFHIKGYAGYARLATDWLHKYPWTPQQPMEKWRVLNPQYMGYNL